LETGSARGAGPGGASCPSDLAGDFVGFGGLGAGIEAHSSNFLCSTGHFSVGPENAGNVHGLNPPKIGGNRGRGNPMVLEPGAKPTAGQENPGRPKNRAAERKIRQLAGHRQPCFWLGNLRSGMVR